MDTLLEPVAPSLLSKVPDSSEDKELAMWAQFLLVLGVVERYQ